MFTNEIIKKKNNAKLLMFFLTCFNKEDSSLKRFAPECNSIMNADKLPFCWLVQGAVRLRQITKPVK